MTATSDIGTQALLYALIGSLAKHDVLTDQMVPEILGQLQSMEERYRNAGDPVTAKEISETAEMVAEALGTTKGEQRNGPASGEA